MQVPGLFGGTVLNRMGNVFSKGMGDVLKAHENDGSR